MKKITSLLFILLLTGILAACGTTAEDVAIEEENITEDTTVEEKE